MKKMILRSFVVLVLMIAVIGCGGSSGTSSDGGGSTVNITNSWTGSADTITIDDIVNGSSGATALNATSNFKMITTNSNAAFYFGRFIYADSSDIFCGSIKFKLNKENNTSAYFSDVSMESMSEVINGTSSNPMVSSSTDLEVDPNYNASTNHVEIANATSRFVGFDLHFGNNDYFDDVMNAGVMFSSDFATMAGGDNANFFFIAQKVDSQPVVSNSDIADDWSALRFSVSSSTGAITLESAVDISIATSNSDSFNSFTGTDSEFSDFDGLLGLTDNTAGCFAYTFGSTIDGGFILSADKSLAVGYDLTTQTYFAMEKIN